MVIDLIPIKIKSKKNRELLSEISLKKVADL